MPLKTIYATRQFPSGAWEIYGLGFSHRFMGYTLREAKRLYREIAKTRGN